MDVEVNRAVKFSIFGKSFTVTKKSAAPFIVFFLAYFLTHVLLNFSAMAHALEYVTTLSFLACVIVLIGANLLLSKLAAGNDTLTKLNTIWWRLWTIGGIYWAIYHSQWSKLTVGVLIVTTLLNFGIKHEKAWAIENKTPQ